LTLEFLPLFLYQCSCLIESFVDKLVISLHLPRRVEGSERHITRICAQVRFGGKAKHFPDLLRGLWWRSQPCILRGLKVAVLG
jgi:hypothetical protein